MRRAALGALALAVAFAGCSSARILPGEDGLHRAVTRERDRDDGEGEVADAAQEYCEKSGKSAVFAAPAETRYTGKMREETRDGIRKVSTVAMVLGGMHPAAGPLGSAGYSVTSDEDYRTELTFRCR